MSITEALTRLGTTVIWAGIIFTITLMFRPEIRKTIHRITRVNILGVDIDIQATIKEELDRAAEALPAGDRHEREQTARRAARLEDIIKGAHILLVNDAPTGVRALIKILRSLNVAVDITTSTTEAMSAIKKEKYDVVISDMRRGGDQSAGINLLQELRRAGYSQPVIFGVGALEPERGVPAYAFGITNRLDEMLHLVFDALERTRG